MTQQDNNTKEGSAIISNKTSVFYNKIQEFNRDLSVCAINAWHLLNVAQSLNLKFENEKDEITGPLKNLIQQRSPPKYAVLDHNSDQCKQKSYKVLEALSATGLRSIRYANELYNASKIIANDLDLDAVEAIKENIKINNVQDKVEANKGNALHVLYESVISNSPYDVIDLDPFGSSSMFLDGAVQAVSEGGLLCITCTDMAVLAGGQSEICWTKYGGTCIRGIPFCHELGIRLLLHTVMASAARYKRVVEPLLCCSIDYYVRIFVRVKTKPELVKLNASQSSILYYCGSCKNFASQPMGRHTVGKNKKGNESHKYSPGRGPPVNKECEFCSSSFHIAGPFYNGQIHDSNFLDVILRIASKSSSKEFATHDRMVGMLSVISEELSDIPFYYCIPTLNNVLHCNAPPQEIVVSAILNAGYRVSETHMMPYSLKTDAPLGFIWDVLKQFSKENQPISEKNLKKESPAFKIYHLPIVNEIDLKKNPKAITISRQFKLVRHQMNPTPNWGPQSRPVKRPRDEVLMRLLVLYASQTGTAADIAYMIARQGRNRHFQVAVSSMDDYDRADLVNESFVVFVASTTGQGSEPDNMKKFWKFLLRKHPDNVLSDLNFAVFGCGDSSYIKFNFPAKKLYKRLMQLGGMPLLPRGDGDDQHDLGVDGALNPWLVSLWTAALELWPINPGLEIISDDSLSPPSFKLKFFESESGLPIDYRPDSDQFKSKITKNIRLTAQDHFQDVRHIELDLENNDENIYEAGDVLLIRPCNDKSNVERILELLGLQDDAHIPFTITEEVYGHNIPSYWPKILTLYNLFRNYLDICGRPRRYFFHLLSFFACSTQHAERLRELASPEGQDDLYSYCYSPKRTILEVLTDFPCKIPADYLLDLIPELKPRSFSISSCPDYHSKSLHLTVAIVNFKTILKEPRTGVCTHWMSGWKSGDVVEYSIQKGSFKLVNDNNIPVIMIGPGTGIAPMRSILWNRISHGAKSNALFFGCRNSSKDFFYQQELQDACKSHNLLLFTAFSRNQENKIYVQDILLQQKELVWNWINLGAFIYISGNSKIPQEIQKTLILIFRDKGLSQQESLDLVSGMEKSGRIQSETWS